MEFEKHQVEQEQIVLGIILKHKNRKKIIKQLSVDNFVGARHRIIFKAIQKTSEKHLEFNLNTIKSLIKVPDADWGGFQYLKQLKNLMGENGNIDFHIQRMKLNTSVFLLQTQKLPALLESLSNPDVSMSSVSETIDEIKREILSSSTAVPLFDNKDIRSVYAKNMKERMLNPNFIGTGFPELDQHLTDGLGKGKITIWAARPRMAKSTSMLNIIDKNMHLRQLVVPIEVGTESCLDTLVSMRTGIPLEKIVKHAHELNFAEKVKVKNTLDAILGNKNLRFLDHFFNKTPKKITTELIAEIVDSHEFDIIYIDLFDRLGDVAQDASVLFRKLQFMQGMVQEKKVHGFFTAQINRRVEREKDKRPTLADLKSSGGFEEIADLAVGLHREKVFNEALNDDILEMIILKQKRGKQTSVAFKYDAPIFKVGEFVKNSNEFTWDILKMLSPSGSET